MYWKHLHLVDNVDWPVCRAMEGNRFEQEPEHSEEIKVNRRLMLLVAQLDGRHEEIEVNRRLMLLVAQLDGRHEEMEVNRGLMLLVAQLDGHHEEIEVNRWQMLLRFYAKFV
jgi:ATP-dependent 26S proteasome regulatory subunit